MRQINQYQSDEKLDTIKKGTAHDLRHISLSVKRGVDGVLA